MRKEVPTMKKILCFLLLAFFLLSGCRAVPETESAPVSGYRSISQAEAMEMMARETDYIILDVRTREEFAERRIEGAICVPNEDITGEPIPQLPDKDQLIFVYCRSGNRSRQASEKLAAMGKIPEVFSSSNVDGGDDVNEAYIEKYRKDIPIL